jgi:hypothetical protein
MTELPSGARPRRTRLQKTRDIALTVMAVLVSVVCAIAIYLAVTDRSAISDVGTSDDPTPSVTHTFKVTDPDPCTGSIPPPDC